MIYIYNSLIYCLERMPSFVGIVFKSFSADSIFCSIFVSGYQFYFHLFTSRWRCVPKTEGSPKRKLTLVDFPLLFGNMANLKHAEHDPKRVEMSGEVLEPCPQNPAVTASSAARVDLVEVPCVIPSFAAASELVSAPYSCLVMNTRRRHVVLPPMYLHKKRTALREELQAELLKFSPR